MKSTICLKVVYVHMLHATASVVQIAGEKYIAVATKRYHVTAYKLFVPNLTYPSRDDKLACEKSMVQSGHERCEYHYRVLYVYMNSQLLHMQICHLFLQYLLWRR